MKTGIVYTVHEKQGGSGLVAERMSRDYSCFRPVLFGQDDITKQRNLWMMHNPFFYSYPLYKRNKDACMVRKQYFDVILGKRVTNGYSYYCRYATRLHSIVPTITDSNYKANGEGVGYYARPTRTDSNEAFIAFAKSLSCGTPITTMGHKESLLGLVGLNWIHTYNPSVFFSSISHYFYFKSLIFEDPFPHTLLEAIQAGARIIVPKSTRNFRDGVDDLLDFIPHDQDYSLVAGVETPEQLTSSWWKPFIENHVANNYPRVSTQYGRLYDWAWRL